MYIPHPCARRAHRNPTTYIHPPSVEVICWYWIYHAKTWGMNVSWSVSVWGIYVSWKYRLVLDILCQHLGAEWSLESFCAPFGRRVGECTFLNIYVGIEYIMPTLGGSMWVVGFLCALRAQGWGIYIFEYIFWYWIYHANTWGKNVSWRVSVRPSGAGLGWVGQTA